MLKNFERMNDRTNAHVVIRLPNIVKMIVARGHCLPVDNKKQNKIQKEAHTHKTNAIEVKQQRALYTHLLNAEPGRELELIWNFSIWNSVATWRFFLYFSRLFESIYGEKWKTKKNKIATPGTERKDDAQKSVFIVWFKSWKHWLNFKMFSLCLRNAKHTPPDSRYFDFLLFLFRRSAYHTYTTVV